MAYTINYAGGTITVTDGTLNVSTSLSLPGRNYPGYGGPVDQNMVSLLENFAYYTASPPNPITGQIWYDTSTSTLKYNTGPVGLPNWVSIPAGGGDATFDNITATGNITAAGNITGDVITGNSIVALDHMITSVETGITATGTTQGTAYVLSKDINVVSSSNTGVADGVVLPTISGGGYRITVINQDAVDTVEVYPSGAGQINSLGVGISYTLAPGARLDFVAISTIQWYTLNATFG